MTSNLGDLHRSRLETMLAVEIEYQRKLLALSNQRIQALKKLLTDVDALHVDVEGDAVLLAVARSTERSPSAPTPAASTKKTEKKKKNKKKATPPTKPVKLVAGKAPRLIDALQMVIRNRQMRPKEAHAALQAKGWLPKTSKDPLGYIRFTLSDEKKIFMRVDGQRGLYELDPSNPYYSGKFSIQPKPSKKSTPDEVEDPPKSSPVKSSPKAAAAPSPPREGSEPPPAITDEDSRNTVTEILEGKVPLD